MIDVEPLERWWNDTIAPVPGSGKTRVIVEPSTMLDHGVDFYFQARSALAHRSGVGFVKVAIDNDFIDEPGADEWIKHCVRTDATAKCPYLARHLK